MSTLHRRRYTRYEGPVEPARTRYLVIAETELRRLLREKWVRRLLIMAWLPVVGHAVYIYFGLVVKSVTGFEVLSGTTSMWFFRFQVWFVAMMMAAFGSGMISRDRTTRALTLYFTRPLGVDQYLLGKFLALAAPVVGVSTLPALLLAGVEYALSDSVTALRLMDMSWRIVVCTGLVTFLYTSTILLLSAMGRTSRSVGLLWLGLFVFMEMVRGILARILGDAPILDVLSLRHLFLGTAEALLTGETRRVPAVVAVCLLSLFVFAALRVRLQQLEREHT